MLFWEALNRPKNTEEGTPIEETGSATTTPPVMRSARLPYDRRCSALTKAGSRCRGRTIHHGEFCLFHDPEIAEKRRRTMATSRARRRRRLSRLPDGYLRKLTTTAAIGSAMDRLYREIRLGVITPEMGGVMFAILSRLLDSDIVPAAKRPSRTKASRFGPKLRAVLTLGERRAWNKAVNQALQSLPNYTPDQESTSPKTTAPERAAEAAPNRAAALVFHVAS